MRLRLARMAVSVHTPPVGVGQTWDAAASVARVRRWAGVDQDDAPASAWTKYRQAFGWFDAERRTSLGAYKLPHHDIERGELVLNRKGLFAAAGALAGARGGVDIPEPDVPRVRAHLAAHYRQIEMDPPWRESASARVAGERVERPMLVARADAERQLLYLIVSRADAPDANNASMSPEVVEESAHAFMQRRIIGVNHMCERCPHDFSAHTSRTAAVLGACRAEQCLCAGYRAFEAPGVELVESFVVGVDTEEWLGQSLVEPMKRGAHVIVLQVWHPMLWAERDRITGASWEGTVELEPAA